MSTWIVTYADASGRYEELCATSAEASQFIWRLHQQGEPTNPMICRYAHIEMSEVLNAAEQAKVDAIRAETAALVQQEGARAMSTTSPHCQIGDHKLCKVVSKSGIRCACECHLTEQERIEKHAAEQAAFEANVRAGYIPTVGPSNADFARQIEQDTGIETIHEDGRDEGFYDFADLAKVEEPSFSWTETSSGYLSVKTFSNKAAAVNAARGLRVPTDAKQDEYGAWHIFSRWNPAAPRTRGGARPGAGRKASDKGEPLYQQGYGAGYHAALRSKLAAGGWLVRRYGSQWEYEAPDHAVVPVERELAEALVEQGIVVADSANSGEEDRWMVFKLAQKREPPR